MVFTTNINIVLSGGAANSDPNLSLGGDPSSTPVADGLVNNLFDDVTADQTEDGHEDYRCVYLFNDGLGNIFNGRIFIIEQVVDGSFIELGVELRDEIQRITLADGPVTGGSFTMSYEGVPFISTFNSDLGVWASELQTTLRSLTDGSDLFFKDILVTASASSDTTIFDITFLLQDGARNHDTFLLVSDSLTPASVDIGVGTPQQGSPINTVAPQISVETTPPGGVGFFVPTEISPIDIPKLRPNDGFPLWVKRVTPPETLAVQNDGFTMRFSGTAFE